MGRFLKRTRLVETPPFGTMWGTLVPKKYDSGPERKKMHRAGFRQLDFQLEEEVFGRAATAYVPAYSSERKAAERVAQRLRDLHPEWRQEIAEDHWGYTVTWHCPWPAGSKHFVLVGEHRSPVLPVAICRAALTAHRAFERYEERRRIRSKEPDLAPKPAEAQVQALRQSS